MAKIKMLSAAAQDENGHFIETSHEIVTSTSGDIDCICDETGALTLRVPHGTSKEDFMKLVALHNIELVKQKTVTPWTLEENPFGLEIS